MCRALAENMRVMKGYNSTDLSSLEMCLVSNVVVWPKFKVSEFEKYKSLNCPNIHLKLHCRKMVAYSKDDKVIIDSF